MKTLKNKIAAFAIAIFFILSMTASLTLMPTTFAATPISIPTWTYITHQYDTLGVGQQQFFITWMNLIPPTANGIYGDRYQLDIIITAPDGTNKTLGPFTSDPTGSTYGYYTPTETGTYAATGVFISEVLTGKDNNVNGINPAQTGTGIQGYTYIGDTLLGSTSAPTYFTVQQSPVPTSWPEPALPTDYWTVPVNAMNRGWSSIVTNWLAGAAQTNGNQGPTSSYQYGTAPMSAHILWSTPFWSGGIMTSTDGAWNYNTFHYDGLSFTPPIVLNGYIYYNVAHYPREGWVCLNLYTGQEVYFENTTGPVTGVGTGFDNAGSITGGQLSFGQIYNYGSPNQMGGFPYLWSTAGSSQVSYSLSAIQPTTVWNMYDAFTGDYICSIANTTWTVTTPDNRTVTEGATGTSAYGPNGEVLRYNIVNLGTVAKPQMYLQCWNTSQVILQATYNTAITTTANAYWMWRPIFNYTFDGRTGLSLNVSIPAVTGSIYAVRVPGDSTGVPPEIIGGSPGINNDAGITDGQIWTLSLDPSNAGTLISNVTVVPPVGVPAEAQQAVQFSPRNVVLNLVDPEDNVIVYSQAMTQQVWCYNLATGALKWNTAPYSEEPMFFYGQSMNVYNGSLLVYSGITGGSVYSYNLANGQLNWIYNATNFAGESPYGDQYTISPMVFSQAGVMYTTTSEHHQDVLLWRGPNLRCINMTTGADVWDLDFYGRGGVLADGYLTILNFDDNSIYTIGKGPSATTVSAPSTAVAAGVPTLITGTVTDQSPGPTNGGPAGPGGNTATTAIPVKGSPCIADAYMSQWMEYMYMQQPMPTNATGVPVSVYVTDPNGNTYDVGTVNSTIQGSYAIPYTPTISGVYTVTASFAGSASYGGSTADSHFLVNPVQSTPVPTATPTSVANTYFVPMSIGIILAIVIIGIVLALLVLRKRP